MKNIAITTGDWDGIGLEITYKALRKLKVPKNRRLFVFFSDRSEKKYKNKIEKEFRIYNTLLDAISKSKKPVCFIKNNSSPARNFEDAVLLTKEKVLSAIVTAPLSKEEIKRSGLADKGHTDIIRRTYPSDKISMAFWGKYFSVALVTDHVPLKDVANRISKEALSLTIQNCYEHAKHLSSSKKVAIGVLGLNPHAGEIDNLGTEEAEIIMPTLHALKSQGIPVSGPLIPDVCFHDPDYKAHTIYVAMYHDQGLIPFKIYHKKRHGVQISLNAPFVRTSVDHGTAKDIFGKDLADPTSMVLAIQKAFQMLE